MTTETAGAVAGAPAIAEASQAVVNDAAATQTKQAEGENPDGQKEVDPVQAELKKLQNALSKRDKKIGSLSFREKQTLRELEDTRRQLAEFQRQQPGKTASDGAPNEDDPKYQGNYAQYLKDVAIHEGRKAAAEHLKEGQTKFQAQQETEKLQAWEAERDVHLDSNAEIAEKAFPDFANVIEDNVDIIRELAPHVKRAFREAENGAFALHDLAQSGQLENLNGMTEYQVAMAVARAEDRALSKSKQKQVTNAPAPISAAKGGGTAGVKSPDQMSAKELLAWSRGS